MRIRTVLAALLALFALLTIFDRFALAERLILRTALPLLMATGVALACVGLGALARRSDEADAPLDLLLGYPLFGTICFVVGTLEIAAWLMITITAIAAAVGVLLLLAGWKSQSRAAAAAPSGGWAALAVVAVMLCAFVPAQAPPSAPDELAYHLAVPQTWVNDGRATELPLLSQSYFPLGIESADLPALSLLGPAAGGVASHFLHLFAAIATAMVILRRTGSWLLTAALVTTPALAVTAGWSLVDWPLAGLFVVLFVALENDDRRLASVATAAGLLVQYTFLPFALVAWALRRRWPQWIVLIGLVFFVRNLILTGNPLAPFFSADAPVIFGFRTLALADYVFEDSFLHEALGAAIVALPAFAVGALPIASALMALGLFFLAPSSRILVPYLLVPSLTAAGATGKRWFAGLLAISVVVQTLLVIAFTAQGGAFSLLAGGVSETAYLRGKRPAYAAIKAIDQMLPRDSRTLVVGIGESYWFTRPVRGGGMLDGARVSRYLDLPTPEAVRARLREDGITHVALIDAPVPTNVAGEVEERQPALSASAQRMLAITLNRYAVGVTSREHATLFTLR
ncbi:MAG: hypothetical protein ABI779_04305 [Acidobacteriota bacterium]